METTARGRLDILAPETWGDDEVFFVGEDVGDEQIADGFHVSGTYDGWLASVRALPAYPRVLLVLYSSFAPPLLEVLDAKNFSVDLASPTSEGKTAALRPAASVWGRPDESGTGTMWTWEKTPVWIERAASVLNSLPLILDDTKLARRPQDVARILYLVASGSGRGRGSREGIGYTKHFRTVLISSGEAAATSMTQDGGTRARTLTLWGSPFERADATTAPVVARLNAELPAHYGHAGPRFVRWLIENRGRWEEFQRLHRERQDGYVTRAAGDPIGGRLAAHFATIDVAAVLAHEALDLPWPYADPIDPLWDLLTREAAEADRAAVALSYVAGWAKRNSHRFPGRQDQADEQRPPHDGWAGRWDPGDDWDFIAFFPDALRRILRDLDFEADPVIRTWKDRGWLDAPKQGRNTKQMRVQGERAELIALRREAIEGDDGRGGNDKC